MKTLSLALLMLVWFLPVPNVQAAPADDVAASFGALETPQEVASTAGLYLPRVTQSKPDRWVVLEVVTDQHSGSLMPGTSVVVSGSYTVAEPLGTPLLSLRGTYFWRMHSPNMLAAAFAAGHPNAEMMLQFESQPFEASFNGKLPQSATRFLLCRLYEKSAGQFKFRNVHIVPDDWLQDVVPAVLYLRAHPELYFPSETGHDKARELLHNPNPYLALTEVQRLAAAQRLTPADMDMVFASQDVKLIACSLRIARAYCWLETDANVRWVKNKLAVDRSMDQLEGIALGLVSENIFTVLENPGPEYDLPLAPPSTLRANGSLWARLVPAVRQKLTELDPGGAAGDKRWAVIDTLCRQGVYVIVHSSKPPC